MWPFKKKVSTPAEKITRWKIDQETQNYAVIRCAETPSLFLLEELLDCGLETINTELSGDGAIFVGKKKDNFDFSKLLQY